MNEIHGSSLLGGSLATAYNASFTGTMERVSRNADIVLSWQPCPPDPSDLGARRQRALTNITTAAVTDLTDIIYIQVKYLTRPAG